jgi:hypothetical protein
MFGSGPLTQRINDLIVDTFLQLYWVTLFKDKEKTKEIVSQIAQNVKSLLSFEKTPAQSEEQWEDPLLPDEN